MTTAMARSEQQQTAAAGYYNREQIGTIKQTVARGANDHQLALFLEVCRSRGLDPFTRQVHWTPNGIICGIDGLRAIADRTESYVPGPTRYEVDGAKLVAAHVTVRKLVSGQWWDVEESAYLEEYGARTPIWREKPRVMLAKCAEARALRRAFPAQLFGLYAPEEMPAEQPRNVTPRREAPDVVVTVEPPHDEAPPDEAPPADGIGDEARKLLARYEAAKDIASDCGAINSSIRSNPARFTDDERAALTAARNAAYARIKAGR
jgi:phage recombination protein Bet